MEGIPESLEDAFEEAGYEVGEASSNRGRVRVVVLDEDADPERLRATVREVVGEDRVFGLDVRNEALDGGETVATVVSFRER